MSFLSVPTVSRKQINKAGKILIKPKIDSTQYEAALQLANKWRVCHAYPLNTFNTTLRYKTSKYKGSPIVAQRLKRMPTIINKLSRYYPDMQLSTMQDIAGVRVVFNNIKDVYKLAEEYKDKSRFLHELVNEKDYINSPRDEDGYRSVHLIYKYKNKLNPEYDGLLVELQIRTKMQHIWATAVESMDIFFGSEGLKFRKGDKDWQYFFVLVSAAISFSEGGVTIKCLKKLSLNQICRKIKKLDLKIKAVETMKGFSTATKFIAEKSRSADNKAGYYYHLIILNFSKRTFQIRSFTKRQQAEAMKELFRSEQSSSDQAGVQVALASAGPIKDFKQAYPNFFLDIREFIDMVEKYINLA